MRAELPLVPFRIEIDTNDTRNITFGIKNGAVRGVKFTPRVCVRLFIDTRSTLCGFFKGVGGFYGRAEFTRVFNSRVDSKGKLTVLFSFNAVYVVELNILLE